MMLTYLSKTEGIGGTIKSAPEDFLVEEIVEDGSILELDKPFSKPDGPGRFVHFVLQKTNWSTSSALSEIADRLRTNPRNLNAAGNKDRMAITTQLASASGTTKDKILALAIKDIKINGAWTAPDKVRMGALLGNRFTITIRGASIGASSGASEQVGDGAVGERVGTICSELTNANPKLNASERPTPNPNGHESPGDGAVGERVGDGIGERANAICGELNGLFPNYFGEQRFGSSRHNTADVGERILRDEFEDAVKLFLCGQEGEENEQARMARRELADTGDYARALAYFPKHLRLERSMLAYLANRQTDYPGALKALPRSMLLLFIHAFQSRMFNLLLSERIKESAEDKNKFALEKGEYYCGETLGFPDIGKAEADGWIAGKIIGYETPLNEREEALLEKLGMRKDAFRMKSLPELASRGTYRTLLAPMKDFNFNPDGCIFRFALPAGSYATVAMREFTDAKGTVL